MESHQLGKVAHIKKPSLRQQAGIATILIVVLIGAAMTATALSLVHSVKSTQQKTITAHAATNAQAAAWAGVENFRMYIEGVEATDLDSLESTIQMSVAGSTIDYAITDVVVEDVSASGKQVTATIVATETAAQASSSVQAVFLVTNAPTCNLCAKLEGNLNFYRDLELSGHITATPPPGGELVINVVGDVTAEFLTGIGIDKLNATGDVLISSGVEMGEVFANGNVTIEGSAHVDTIYTLGNVVLDTGEGVDTTFANGSVDVKHAQTDNINSLDDVSISSGAHNIVTSNGSVSVSGTTTISEIHSTKDIDVSVDTPMVTIQGQGDVSCPTTSWGSPPTVAAEGSLSNCPSDPVNIQGNLASVPVTVMEPLLPFSMPIPVVDVRPLKPAANYVFEIDSDRMKVTVSNVEGITDGSYFLGDISGQKDFLCDSVTVSGDNCLLEHATCNCDASAAIGVTRSICQSYSDYNECFTYDKAAEEWKVAGTNVAPGVMWFEGNLNVSNGHNYNTFLATGNLRTTGGVVTHAINFADSDDTIAYNAICNGDYPANPTTKYSAPALTPTNYCDTVNGVLTYSPLGNIAFMAGSFNSGVFSGGDIYLDANNQVFGTVISGDNMSTGGDTTVHGYVAAIGQSGSGDNLLNGQTDIILNNLPATYNPTELPTMDGSSCQTSCPVYDEGAKLFWSKYL